MDIRNFITNGFADPSSGQWLEVVEPATGEVYGRVAASGAEDVQRAVDAAKRAFGPWSSLAPAERADAMDRVAQRIEDHLEDFAQAESKDNGKPLALARSVDIPRAIANLRFFAQAVRHTKGETYNGVAGFNTVHRQPRGIAGCISPWNLPLYLLTWKIAPALATGNTVIAKPSEVTPLTAQMLAQAWNDVGAPPGVLNIIQGRGDEAGKSIVEHPEIPTITFTGSTAVGQWIGATAGRMLKRASLELGGKNPLVVFEDVDLDSAVATGERAAFTNQGQICLCGSRLLVHESIYDEFVERIVARAQARLVGDPTDESTEHGAQVSAEHLEKIDSYVKLARELGGEIRCGGGRIDPAMLPARCKGGFFYEPTVITDLDNDCRVIQEEIFGPVVTVQPFRDEDQAIALANSTPYGLAASILSKDLERANRVAAQVDAGVIWINCWMVRDLRTPFGGMKQSGVGREGGEEAIKFFTEAKNVCIAEEGTKARRHKGTKG